jgi:hypothetical protein
MKRIGILLILAYCLFNFAKGQVYVNREWQDSTGNPVFNPILNQFGVQWSNSFTNGVSQLITVGHTDVSNQGENILLTKHDPNGNLIFSTNFNVGGNCNDYGIAAVEDGSGNIYVCGTTDNCGNTDYDVVVLKYNAIGQLQNSAIFGSLGNLNDVGIAININSLGDIYIAASSENSSTMYDYWLLKIDPVLTLQWSSVYDYNSLNEIPVAVDFGTVNTVLIAGASASSLTNWDYSVVTFDESTGNYVSDTRDTIPGVGYDQPLAFTKDASNNVYITGRASTDGVNYNIRTAKILANGTLAWSVAYDGYGLDDVGNAIAVDQNGDVIVGGFETKSNNTKDLICLKYTSSGTQSWKFTLPSSNIFGDAYIKKLGLNSDDDIYFVAGQMGNTGYKQVLIGKIKSSGITGWRRAIEDTLDILPSDIDVTTNGIYVISVLDALNDSYLTTKYTEFELDTGKVYKSNGKPVWKKHELVVGFMPNALNKNTIDNLSGTKIIQFGELSDFLTVHSYSQVITAFEGVCRDCEIKAVKIYSGMKTTDTLDITRLNQNISVPPFWTNLVLEFPSYLTLAQAHGVLNTIPNIVSYSHPNYFVSVNSPPNDSLYPLQFNLHDSLTGLPSDINVEEAWDIVPSGGRPYARCGVFDFGFHWKHPDFGYTGSITSGKMEGWDFIDDINLRYSTNGDSINHGTPIMGIIGANRNNSMGVSGIAGGDAANQNSGISLFGLNLRSVPVSVLAMAMKETVSGSLLYQYSYRLNLSSNSWYIDSISPFFTDPNIVLLTEALHFINRMNVTFVVARGNQGMNNLEYPATIDSTWVICVGGTASNGEYKNMTYEEPGWAASYGSGVDVAAPAVYSLIRTTGAYAQYPYPSLNGTSASAPHVAGVVGLLMTYMNDTTGGDNYYNLAPEDCEYILQKSATDVGASGWDLYTGFGRLNAGKALRMIEKPYNILYHYGTNILAPHTINVTPFSSGDTIILTERYQNYAYPRKTFQIGKYFVKTFLVNATVSHNSTYPSDSLKYFWPRHSSSYVYPLFNSQNRLRMHENIQITSCSGSSASLKGYVYQVWDSSGVYQGWWPCDTTFTSPNLGSLFEYSLLTKNKAVGIKKNEISLQKVSVFPNPSNFSQTLLIDSKTETECIVELYDLMGRCIKTVYKGKATIGRTTITHYIDKLPNSMYIYIIRIDGKEISKKFIKE